MSVKSAINEAKPPISMLFHSLNAFFLFLVVVVPALVYGRLYWFSNKEKFIKMTQTSVSLALFRSRERWKSKRIDEELKKSNWKRNVDVVKIENADICARARVCVSIIEHNLQ